MQRWRAVSGDILLQRPRAQDALPLYMLVQSNRQWLGQWLPWVDAMLQGDNGDSDALPPGEAASHLWLIRVNGELAGACDLHAVSATNHHATVGYWLGRDYSGYGIMQQALRQLQDKAFGELGLHRLMIVAAAANLRSCAVAERAGFRRESLLREHLYLHGRYWDALQYGRLAHEWNAPS